MTKRVKAVFIIALVIAGTRLLTSAEAQDRTRFYGVATEQLPVAQQRTIRVSAPTNGANDATACCSSETHKNVTAAVTKLKQAKTIEEKEAATKELRKGLDTEYENSIEQYEAKIQQMEERLAAVREGLDRRKAAKDEMIELRLKTLLHKADGLGWPDSDTRSAASNPFLWSPVNNQSGPAASY